MLIFTSLFGAIIIALFWLHWYQTRSRIAKLLNAFPGPDTRLFIGNTLQLSNNPPTLFIRLKELMSSYKETLRIWVGHYGSLHVVTCDDAEILLSNMKNIEKGFVYTFLSPWLGPGLLLSTGTKWQNRRKILTPSFHFNILRNFVTVFGEHCDVLVTKLKVECEKPKTDILPLMTDLTLATICETAMGTKLCPNDKTQRSYKDALYKLGFRIIHRSLTPILYSDLVFNSTPYGWLQSKYIKTLHSFTGRIIEERERNFKEEDMFNLADEENVYKSKKRLAMLDLLISAKRNTSEIDYEGIKEEVETFMFEGHDTTSMAICYILLALANHQNVQDKVIMELDEIFATSKRSATLEDLQRMKYTELCIKESLRLYPSVPIITRLLSEDTQLTHHLAPAGVEIYIHIYHIHRDPKYFPDPEKFDPNRFLPENSKDRDPYAYIPFSAGARNCIGQRYAMLELKCIIAAVLRNFKLAVVDSASDLTWVTDLVLRTNGAINIKFQSRE